MQPGMLQMCANGTAVFSVQLCAHGTAVFSVQLCVHGTHVCSWCSCVLSTGLAIRVYMLCYNNIGLNVIHVTMEKILTAQHCPVMRDKHIIYINNIYVIMAYN